MTSPSDQQIEAFKQIVADASSQPGFVHHPWFVKYHLEIVDRIADELLAYYPGADTALVKVMVWLHDYGKALDFDNQYARTITEGRKTLTELAFDPDFIDRAISYIELMDKKMEVDLHEAPIEVQIVASADGCSHMVGPFMSAWRQENSQKPFAELMQDTLKKVQKDWDRKIVLPEARRAFEMRRTFILEQSGVFPANFLRAD